MNQSMKVMMKLVDLHKDILKQPSTKPNLP
jgi:hypothetical protein